jgi:hypothetical protein
MAIRCDPAGRAIDRTAVGGRRLVYPGIEKRIDKVENSFCLLPMNEWRSKRTTISGFGRHQHHDRSYLLSLPLRPSVQIDDQSPFKCLYYDASV